MLKPGQNYDIMLLVYDFHLSKAVAMNQIAMTPYCFHIALPVRTGITTFRCVRIGINTGSLSPPALSSPQGLFHADPKGHMIALEVIDNNWMQIMEETAELYAPARTFLSYISAHPPPTTAADSSPPGRTRSLVVDVPWEAWGPYGAHIVRDQTYIIPRPRACGMRVLGASLSRKSVIVTDYHPGRIARGTKVGVGTLAATTAAAAAATATATTNNNANAAHARAPSSFWEMRQQQRRRQQQQQQQQGMLARRQALVCVKKEVPMPRELRDASESPWTMLCEDALLAFEVSFFSILFIESLAWMACCLFGQSLIGGLIARMRSMSRMGSRSAGCSRTRSSRTM
jgi:hypothetical protein